MDTIEDLRDLLTDIIDFNGSKPTESDWKNILGMVTTEIDITCDDCGCAIEFEIKTGGVSIELCESCVDDVVIKDTEDLNSEIENLEVEVEKLQKELIDIFGITKYYDLNG